MSAYLACTRPYLTGEERKEEREREGKKEERKQKAGVQNMQVASSPLHGAMKAVAHNVQLSQVLPKA